MRQEKITQLSFDELLDQQQDITAYDPNLTKLENRIKDYIFKYHKGYENGVTQEEIGEIFDIPYKTDDSRKVREILNNIKNKSLIPFDSGSFGYFACIIEKGERRNGHIIKRTTGSIERTVKADPGLINYYYKFLNELKAEL